MGTTKMQASAARLGASLRALAQDAELEAMMAVLSRELVESLDAIRVWVGYADPLAETLACAGSTAATPDPQAELTTIRQLLPIALEQGGQMVVDWDHPALAASAAVLEAVAAKRVAVFAVALEQRTVMVVAWLRSAGDEEVAQWSDEISLVLTRAHVLERRRVLERALNSAGNSIFLTDAQARIVWINPAFTRLTGYEAHEVLGRNPRLLKSGYQGERYYRKLWQTVSGGQVWSAEAVDRDRYGFIYAIQQTISPVLRDGKVTHYLSIHDDVTRRRHMRREKERKEHIEVNTRLLTSTAFHDALGERLNTARLAHQGVAVISFSLSNFSSAMMNLSDDMLVNVLGEMGQRLQLLLGKGDEAGYLGEGNFGAFFGGIGSRDQAQGLVDRIRSAFETRFAFLGEDLYLELVAGIALYPQDGEDGVSLWRKADDGILHGADASE